MNYADQAKVMTTDELLKKLEEECTNPTIQRLMFIETKAHGDIPGKVFPCYLEAWRMPEEGAAAQANPEIEFGVCIVQSVHSEFGMVRVRIRASELGADKRIWNLPPGEALRNRTPFVDSGVIQ